MGTENFLTPKFSTRAWWQCHSSTSRLWPAWKSTKELAASEATMNIKYWLRFLPRPFFTIASTVLFAGRSLVLADMLSTILQGLEDHSSAWSSFELTLQMNTSCEPSQEQNFQNGCLRVHIACVILVPKISTVENFIFIVGWTNENILTPNFCQFTVL